MNQIRKQTIIFILIIATLLSWSGCKTESGEDTLPYFLLTLFQGDEAGTTPGERIRYAVVGTVKGLKGTLVLQNNNMDDLVVKSNGIFVFADKLLEGEDYSVTVHTQPDKGPRCGVEKGSGMVMGDIKDISVICAERSIGGTIKNLRGEVILQNNGGDDLTQNSNGGFRFSGRVPHGGRYFVTIAKQPTGQLCSVTRSRGTAKGNVTNIAVVCSSFKYSIGGTVSRLNGTVVLQNNGRDDLALTANGSFTFGEQIAHGSGYEVTVKEHPANQICIVEEGAGVALDNVANVSVVCEEAYTVGGTVEGIRGAITLEIITGKKETIRLSRDKPFSFPTPVFPNTRYNVIIKSQPTWSTCILENASGTVNRSNVESLKLKCITNPVLYGYFIYRGGDLGGRSGVDSKCRGLWDYAVSYKHIRGFITVKRKDEIRDMPANYSVPTRVRIYGPNGKKIADDWDDLLDGSIDVSLKDAGVIESGGNWWSGSTRKGKKFAGKACGRWKVAAIGKGRAGSAGHTNRRWISDENLNCGHPGYIIDQIPAEARLVCIAWGNKPGSTIGAYLLEGMADSGQVILAVLAAMIALAVILAIGIYRRRHRG